jgi:hypothetical protein
MSPGSMRKGLRSKGWDCSVETLSKEEILTMLADTGLMSDLVEAPASGKGRASKATNEVGSGVAGSPPSSAPGPAGKDAAAPSFPVVCSQSEGVVMLVCSQCKQPSEFSEDQKKKPAATRRCKTCCKDHRATRRGRRAGIKTNLWESGERTGAIAAAATTPSTKEATVGGSTQSITLLRPWDNGYNDAWLVSYEGAYSNDRPPHIAVGVGRVHDSFREGQTFMLENKRTEGPATMWTVAGTGRSSIHFTVAFQRRSYY